MKTTVSGVPMTIDLDALEALANAASMGPWEWNQRSEHDCSQWGLDGGRGEVVLVAHQDVVMVRSPADRDFIATAREAVPELIAEVRRLREKNRELNRRAQASVAGANAVRARLSAVMDVWRQAHNIANHHGQLRKSAIDRLFREACGKAAPSLRGCLQAMADKALAETLDRWDREDAEAKK